MRKAIAKPSMAGLSFMACVALACSSDEERCDEVPNGPLMRPGQNCLRCHTEGAGTSAPPWSAAGTVYETVDADVCAGVEGAKVLLSAPDGKTIELLTNGAGNFYTGEPLADGFRVAVEYAGRRREMPDAP